MLEMKFQNEKKLRQTEEKAMKYYAFSYMSGRQTTIGEPHTQTGRYSIAGFLHVFTNKHERDAWVDNGLHTCDMGGDKNRQALSAREARKHHLGMSVDAYNEMVEMLEDL